MKFSIATCCFFILSIGHIVNGRPQAIAELQLARGQAVSDNALPSHAFLAHGVHPKGKSTSGGVEKRARGRGRPQRRPSTGSRPGTSPDRSHQATPKIPDHETSSESEDSPLKDKGKGKLRTGSRPDSSDRSKSKSPDRSKSKAAGKQPVKQPEKKKTIYLGKCGSRAKIKPLKGSKVSSKDPSPKRPLRSGRTRQQVKRGRSKAAKGKGVSKTLPVDSGTKNLAVCSKWGNKKSTQYQVGMKFPKYPTSGNVIGAPRLKAVIHAYNAADPDPCSDNYNFGRRPPPKTITEDGENKLWSPDGSDKWTTEHALDGQILQKFFLDVFERKGKVEIPQDSMPKRYRVGARSNEDFQDKPARCQYLNQFWQVRFSKRDGADVPENNAMEHLLQVFPGINEHVGEFTLLPQRLNSKKERLFTSYEQGKDLIALRTFKGYTFHAKIDALREVVLLQKYMNEESVSQSFKDTSNRIKDRLAEIESSESDGYMRQTDNYWQRVAQYSNRAVANFDSSEFADEGDEVYRSVELANRWEYWIFEFVRDRVDNLEHLKIQLWDILEDEYEKMQTYSDFTREDRKIAKKRMDALFKAINRTKVNVRKLTTLTVANFRRPKNPPKFANEPKHGSLSESHSSQGHKSHSKPSESEHSPGEIFSGESSGSGDSQPGAGPSVPKAHRPLAHHPKTPANQQQ